MTLNVAFPNSPEPIAADTLVVYLIDRSGSMTSCWDDTIGGCNGDIQKLQEDAEGTDAAIFVFDSSYSESGWSGTKVTNLQQLYWGSLANAPILDPTVVRPGGGTPLYDSVGKLIEMIRQRVEASDPKPNVLITILTDGGNTDSQGYSADQVKTMIETCQGQGWTFTYLGANQDAWAVGSQFGIAAGNTMSYSVGNMASTMSNMSMARKSFVAESKQMKSRDPSAAYATRSFFADAGQSEEDYEG